MKKVSLWTLAAALVLGAGSLAVAEEKADCDCGKCKVCATQPSAKKYVCPMGCASSDKPGKCPKCGMDMVEKKAPAHTPAHDHQH